MTHEQMEQEINAYGLSGILEMVANVCRRKSLGLNDDWHADSITIDNAIQNLTKDIDR